MPTLEINMPSGIPPDQQGKYCEARKLEQIDFPGALDAYLGLMRCLNLGISESEIHSMEERIKTCNSSRTRKQEFIITTKKICSTFLGVSPLESNIDVLSLTTVIGQFAAPANIGNALTRQQLVLNEIDAIDKSAELLGADYAKRSKEILYTGINNLRDSLHGTTPCHWKSALALFNSHPELYLSPYSQV